MELTDEELIDGYYRFRAAPGRAKVYASYYVPKGYQPVGQVEKYVNVVEAETLSGVDFQFQKGIELTGTVVTFDGNPVVGVKITGGPFDPEYATSDKNGRFTITGLSPGQKLSLKSEQRELHLRGCVKSQQESTLKGNVRWAKMKTRKRDSVLIFHLFHCLWLLNSQNDWICF